jgi:uncharacterized protein YegL
LAQVVARLPKIYLYASEQDESGNPFGGGWGDLSTLIGPTYTTVKEIQGPQGIAIVFLLDISKSLSRQQFELIRASVRAWIESLNRPPAGPPDQAAIVTFGSSVKTVQDFTADKRALNNALNPLGPSDMQTFLYQGLVQAIDLSRRLDHNLPLRRAIVVLTDGMDEEKGGAGRQEVLDKLAVDPVPIYGLGASADYNAKNKAKVDAALKDFSGLVRISGGEYRDGDIRSPDIGFIKLHEVVSRTKPLVAECPTCTPDGSAIVVRLFMSQEAVRLSSQSIKVQSVNDQGKVVQPPASEPPKPPVEPPKLPVDTVKLPVDTVKPPVEPHLWSRVSKFFINLPLQWLTILALIAGGLIAGVVILMRRSPKQQPKDQEPPKTTRAEPDNSLVQISPRVLVPSGAQQDKQRLRLYPIGYNDIGPFDLLFEETLSVGRSPESEICISNDGQVSASHCALSPKGKSILVEDVGSRNGTRVNGVPINGFLHAETDSVLGVGRTELRMKLLPVGAR